MAKKKRGTKSAKKTTVKKRQPKAVMRGGRRARY